MEILELKKKLAEICGRVAYKQRLIDEPDLKFEELGGVTYAITNVGAGCYGCEFSDGIHRLFADLFDKASSCDGKIYVKEDCLNKNLKITSQSMLYLAREIVKIFEEEAKQKENPTIPV